ncbi:hypothetical protein ACLB2K_013458 [Fragaria x ananassa]
MNLRHYDLHLETFTLVVAIINRASDSWNLEAISPSIPLEARHAVITTQFGSASDHDRQIWARSSSGEYSVKSGYAVQNASMRLATSSNPNQSHSVPGRVWSWIWKVKMLPKIRHFLWRAVSNCLATNERRVHRHLAANLMCPLCDAKPETIEHCLLLCPLVRQVWCAHPFSYSIDSQSISSLDRWIDGVFIDKDDHCDFGADFETIVSFLLWNIWKARCNLVFNKAAFDPVQTASTAFRLAQEFMLIPQKLYKSLACPISNPDGVVQHWINPKLGMIKINTDAACLEQRFGRMWPCC